MEASHTNVELAETGARKTAESPLSVDVKKAVDRYFQQLNGHETAGLYAMVMGEVERPLLQSVLEHTGHNQTKAAKILGLSRGTLRKKLDEYNLS